MAISEKVATELFVLEVQMTWLAFSQEFGNTPEELGRLEKCKWRKGELMFDELQKKLNIPTGDPFTVAKALGDYLTKTGYAKVEIHKVSDTQIRYDMGDVVMAPMVPIMRSRGRKVGPEVSTALFFAAFKKLCNVKAEHIPVPDYLQVSIPEDMEREMWRLSPLK